MNTARGWMSAGLFLAGFLVWPTALYLYVEQPWYAGEVTTRVERRSRSSAGPVNVTALVADLFPIGTLAPSARKLLTSNGFQCIPNTTERAAEMLTCRRSFGGPVCSDAWTVHLYVRDRQLVSGVAASAHAMCL